MHRAAGAGFVFVVMTLAGAPVLVAQEPPGASRVATVVTTGEASVSRAPDQAFVTVAVETRSRTPRDAQRQNADVMSSVRQRVERSGIGREAVRTTGYSIQEEFDFNDGRRTSRGYVARNGLEVRVDAMEKVGDLLDAVVQAGATNVAGIRFDLKDRAGAERDALRMAVADARARADAMASGVGRKVAQVLRITDTPQPVVSPRADTAMLRMAAAPAQATPVDAGLIEIRAQVELTAALE